MSNAAILGIGISGTDGIEKSRQLLAGISGGMDKAVKASLKRAVARGETTAARDTVKRYYLKKSDFRKYTSVKARIYGTDSETAADLSFRGTHVPLIRFKADFTSSGYWRTTVKRGECGGVGKRFFRAAMDSGHIGLFERKRASSLPIIQKYGPSVPQMMKANSGLAGDIDKAVRGEFEKRLEHETLAILNGWRN